MRTALRTGLPLLLLFGATEARADLAPSPTDPVSLTAIAIFAVVVGMMAAIFIWRRRR